MNSRHDAVVIGAGPAGSTAALLLARAGWSVAILERKPFPRRKVCGEYLSATNLPLFDHLGIGSLLRDMAGPSVSQVGVYSGKTTIQAPLPRPADAQSEWGRALTREHLDTLLLNQARAAGVEVCQPWTVDQLIEEEGEYHCDATSLQLREQGWLRAPVVIAAHGSWEPGRLPTQFLRAPPLPDDLLAFKAHFLNSDLPAGLMPLLAFPGGYGGMVHCDGGRVSLSCCIRRDQLASLRCRTGAEAGETAFEHIMDSCTGAKRALMPAHRDGAWLAAGPIRPGVRLRSRGGIFCVGNAAGEAHPIIAEGISMAMQSAWLLCRLLIDWRRSSGAAADFAMVSRRYAQAWRRAFAPRLNTSRLLAEWAMRPLAVAGTLPLIWCFPNVLTWFARLSGKATRIVN